MATTKVTITVPTMLIAAVREQSAKDGLNLSAWVSEALACTLRTRRATEEATWVAGLDSKDLTTLTEFAALSMSAVTDQGGAVTAA